MSSNPTHQQALEQVQQALGGRSPAYLTHLSVSQLEDVAQAIEKAKAHEQSVLLKALDDALQVVPRLLRGTLKNMLFPKSNTGNQ